ncbi:MAG: polysaccharide deacetylase family protein [Anaerolineae bacterium]|nr:polysaccharide deacetylase family protein [Anaerolineae bacterium]
MIAKYFRHTLLLGLLVVLLTGCGSSTNLTPTPADPAQIAAEALATIQAEYTQTAEAIPPTDSPTETPIPSPTAIRTPPALSEIYQSPVLHSLDIPRTYIDDTCEYLNAKWDPNKSAPGTAVMVVMIHSITKGIVDKPNQISADDLRQLLEDLHEQGFEAINTTQLAGFLESNEKIPMRSVLLTSDDRHYAQYFNNNFRPFYEKYGWTVTNGFISHPDTLQLIWDENAALAAEGWVDYQAHGVIHNIPMSNSSSDEYLVGELQGSIAGIREHYGNTPIAIIWPGGGFGVRPIEIAREYGYRLGFTTNPRGPMMFNWIPLTDIKDEQRPYFFPEGAMNDPLMTLPRYIDLSAGAHIDEVRVIGKEAAAYAEQNKATELEYYDIVCAPTYGAISTLAP